MLSVLAVKMQVSFVDITKLGPQGWLTLEVVAALSAAAPAVQARQNVYDNSTTTANGAASFSALEQGDDVWLGPDAPRSIDLLEIGLTQQGTAGTSELLARLYANDGPDGEPGTLLRVSELFRGVSLTGGYELIPFEVPNVTVPDVFTWTIQTFNATPVDVDPRN